MDSQLKEIFKNISAEKHYAPCTYSEIPSGKTDLNITSGQNANWTYANFFVQNDKDSVDSFRINEGQYVIKKNQDEWILLDYKQDIKATGIDDIRAFVNSIADKYRSFSQSLDSLNEKKGKCQGLSSQVIYYGAPGTGKSHIINEITEGESVIRTTFHPDSDYSTFVGAYKPTTKEVILRDLSGHPVKENGVTLTEDKIIYEFVDQAFLQAYVQAWKYYAEADESSEPQKQYLIIEEINRGNCAQIFGDLFQLLDRNCSGFSDYPINADNDMKKQLAKAFAGLSIAQSGKINACYKGKDVTSKVLSGEILLLPNNLYIWATMNTSDQSLFPIDSAFKRRWDWQYMPICKGRDKNGNELNWKIVADTKEYDWWSFLTKINDHINSTTNSEDKKLGFFFCKPQDGCISSETFVGKVIFYLWNDVFKDFGFEGPTFKDTDGSELSFNKFYKTDDKGKAVVQKDKVELFLNNLGVSALGDIDEALEQELTGSVDRTKYSFEGNTNLGKSALGSMIVDKYLGMNPLLSFDEIKNKFPDSLLGNIPGPGLIVKEDVSLGSYARYYKTGYLSGDGIKFNIFKQWTIGNINNIIDFASSQNWTIEKV